MLPEITDTNPEADKIQVLLIRKASVAKRISRMRSLSQTTIQLSRRALLRPNPKLSERELNLKFVSLHYGKDLANRLCKYMERKSDEKS